MIRFNTTLTQQFSGNKRLSEVRNLQAKLFDTRRKTIQDELSMIQETLDGLVGQTDNLNKIKGYRDHQFSLINRELGAIRALSEKNYYPKAQLLVLEREAAEISGSVSEDILNIAKLKSQQNELKIKAYQVRHQYLREVESELTENQKKWQCWRMNWYQRVMSWITPRSAHRLTVLCWMLKSVPWAASFSLENI